MIQWLSTMNEIVVSAANSKSNSLVELPLMSKGLLATVVGLLGVFLVLALFYATIKLMQRIQTKEGKN